MNWLQEKIGRWKDALIVRMVDKEWPALSAVIADMERTGWRLKEISDREIAPVAHPPGIFNSLFEALLRYAKHQEGCPMLDWDPRRSIAWSHQQCSCGLFHLVLRFCDISKEMSGGRQGNPDAKEKGTDRSDPDPLAAPGETPEESRAPEKDR